MLLFYKLIKLFLRILSSILYTVYKISTIYSNLFNYTTIGLLPLGYLEKSHVLAESCPTFLSLAASFFPFVLCCFRWFLCWYILRAVPTSFRHPIGKFTFSSLFFFFFFNFSIKCFFFRKFFFFTLS